jgi:glycosyltransferase involved in cell wall biosynthesis
MEPPGWAFKDYNIILKYFANDKIRIFVMEGLEHNWNILKYFKENDYIFIVIPWYFDEFNFKYGIECMKYNNPNYNINNIIFMCPSNHNMMICKNLGYSYILCNHNCFINEKTFHIKNDNGDSNRLYKAVLNCRPEKWKRPYLAKKVDNLAILKGYNFRKDDYYDLNLLNPIFINNDIRLNENEVVDIYSKSMVGLIFSEKEGACYSSSEFLLCGLPVISTKSVGGRDEWYNEKNSIICEDNEESVLECVNMAINKLKSGEFNRNEIRSNHIIQSYQHRMNMINYTYDLFIKHNIDEDPKLLFAKNFSQYNRMKKIYSTSDAIKMLNA